MEKTKFSWRIVILTLLATFLSFSSYSQNNWSLGLRLGDPTGITAKKYMGNNALEISLGRTHWFDGYGYGNRFNDWYGDQNFGYTDFQYLGHSASQPVGVQVHYLFHKDLTKIGDESISGLDWYFGFGGQMRYQRYSFDYRYKVPGNPAWLYTDGGNVTDIDIGADGVIGLEYTFDNVPFSVFLDATLFLEIIDEPFEPWVQAGIGGRYNF